MATKDLSFTSSVLPVPPEGAYQLLSREGRLRRIGVVRDILQVEHLTRRPTGAWHLASHQPLRARTVWSSLFISSPLCGTPCELKVRALGSDCSVVK